MRVRERRVRDRVIPAGHRRAVPKHAYVRTKKPVDGMRGGDARHAKVRCNTGTWEHSVVERGGGGHRIPPWR